MKISQETLSVLKSFATINTSIYVKPGKELKTISAQKTVLASAKIDDEFDIAFGIYDLNQFLSTIALFKDPDFDFAEKHVTISDGDNEVIYGYVEPSVIFTPPDRELTLPDEAVSFRLSEEHLSTLLKAAAVMGLPNLCVEGKDGELSLVVRDAAQKSGNTYKCVVGTCDADVLIKFRIENIHVVPGDYDVVISSKSISRFVSDDERLTYFIATEANA